MPLGISAREFGRRDGCAHTLVNRAVKAGHLKALPDGSLDPADVGTGWRAENRRGGNSKVETGNSFQPVETVDDDAETIAEAAERIIASSGAPYDRAEAERIKENYLALLRQLEYDEKSGAVVPVAEISRIVGDAFAAVRTRLMAIPAEQAPKLHRLKTVAEVQAHLLEIVTRALKELSSDGLGASVPH